MKWLDAKSQGQPSTDLLPNLDQPPSKIFCSTQVRYILPALVHSIGSQDSS